MKWLTAATLALALAFTTSALAQDDFDDLDALLADDAGAPAAEAGDAGADEFDALFDDAAAPAEEAAGEVAEAADDFLDDAAAAADDFADDAAAFADDTAAAVEDVAEDVADSADDFGALFADSGEEAAAADDFAEDLADSADAFADDTAAAADDFASDLFGDVPDADAFDADADVASADEDFGDGAFDEDMPELEADEADVPRAAPALAQDKRVDPKEAKKIAKEIARLEEVRRQAAEDAADALAKDGFDALDAGKPARAAEAFASALEQMPVREQTAESRARIAWGLAQAKYLQAANYAKEPATYPDARAAIDDGLAADPTHLGLQRLSDRLSKLEAEEAQPKPPAKQAGTLAKQDDLKALYKEARQWYALGDYNRSEALFERMLEIDPYNRPAIRYLNKLGRTEYKVATMEYHARRENMVADVRRTWSPPNRQSIEIPEDAEGQGRTSTKPRSAVLTETMNSIVIPKLEFRQANIADVVNYLVEASIAADPKGEGVNIILNLGPASVPSAPAASSASSSFGGDEWGDDFGGDDFGASMAPASDGTSIPPITLNLRKVTMANAIQYITEVAQLKYRVEDSAVIITRKDAPTGNIITRMYSVQPSFMTVIQEPNEMADNGGDFVSMGQDVTLKKGDVKEFFENTGVQFPTGASITYNPTISQLIVANTAENLEAFERILQQINIVPNQVEIEARFIEVNQDDLEELGLQWSLNSRWEIAHKKDGSGAKVVMDAGSITRANRFFIRDNSKDITTATSTSLIDTINQTPIGSIASFASVLTNPELGLAINAISQHGASDLLSAPKVTTRSGAPAIIQVVREIRYPNDYDLTQPTTDSDGNVTMGPVVQPTDFQMRPTGVILNVTPTVGPDGYTIDLMLEPEVCDLVEWIDYGSSFTVQTSGNLETGSTSQTQSYNFKMDQPVFRSSKVNTSLVIWDGQTVVMGGLIREDVVTFHDKIPILGDIPLLGWFFRTNGEYSQKKNLLIFVTARLVDPAGRPVHGDNAVLPGAGIDTSPVTE